MRVLILACLLILFGMGISCEDKNSKAEKTTQVSVEKKKDTSAKARAKAQNDSFKNKVGAIIPTQAELKPTLKEYGRNNPETRVRLKTPIGDVEFELYTDTPLHRANFILLVKQDYFNKTMIHRVSPGFVVQGGNSEGYETPKKRQRIGNYLLPNEAKDKYPHVRGALSAAKYLEQNISDASSPFEFFVVQSTRGAHHLDGEHTVFGRVTKGMDVIDEINKVEVDGNEWPKKNIYIDMELIE